MVWQRGLALILSRFVIRSHSVTVLPFAPLQLIEDLDDQPRQAAEKKIDQIRLSYASLSDSYQDSKADMDTHIPLA